MALQEIRIRTVVDTAELERARVILSESAREAGVAESAVEKLARAYRQGNQTLAQREAELKNLRRQESALLKLQTDSAGTDQAREYEKQLKRVRSEIESVEKTQRDQKKLVEELTRREAALEKARREANDPALVRRFNDELAKTRAARSVADGTTQIPRPAAGKGAGISGLVGSFAAGAAGGLALGALGAIQEAATTAIQSISEARREVLETERIVKQITTETGEEIDAVAAQGRALSRSYGADFREQILTVNALVSTFQTTNEEAFAAISEGFAVGNNAQGDYLDRLREYAPFYADLKLDLRQVNALINTEIGQGVFSDKGTDALKEATISLREMTPATRDALLGIGFTSREIEQAIEEGANTSFEFIQEISRRTASLESTSRKVGAVYADVFRGAGEDSSNFVRSLSQIDLSFQAIQEQLGVTYIEQQRLTRQNVELEEAWGRAFGEGSVLARTFHDALQGLKLGFANLVGSVNQYLELPLDQQLQREQSQFNALAFAASQANLPAEERARLIRRMNTEYGAYLPNLLNEKASIDEVKAAQTSANEAFAKRIQLLALEEAAKNAAGDASQTIRDLGEAYVELSLQQERVAAAQSRRESLEGDFFNEEAANRARLAAADELRILRDIEERIESLKTAFPGLTTQAEAYQRAASEYAQQTGQAFEAAGQGAQQNAEAAAGAAQRTGQSIAQLNERLAQLNTQFEGATTDEARASIRREIEVVQQELLRINPDPKTREKFEARQAEIQGEAQRIESEVLRLRYQIELETAGGSETIEGLIIQRREAIRQLLETEAFAALETQEQQQAILNIRETFARRIEALQQSQTQAEVDAARRRVATLEEEAQERVAIASRILTDETAAISRRELAISQIGELSSAQRVALVESVSDASLQAIAPRRQLAEEQYAALALTLEEDVNTQRIAALEQYTETATASLESLSRANEIVVAGLTFESAQSGLNEAEAAELEERLELQREFQERANALQQEFTEAQIAENRRRNKEMAATDAERGQNLIEGLQSFGEVATFATNAYTSTIDAIFDAQASRAEGNEKKMREIEERRFKANQAAALANVAINTAAAIVKGAQIFGPPPSPAFFVMAALTAAMGATQAGAILSTKPQFREGVFELQGPGSETSDSIDARLSRNETVIPAQRGRKYRDAVKAIFFEEIPAEAINEFVRGYKFGETAQTTTAPATTTPVFLSQTSGPPALGLAFEVAATIAREVSGRIESRISENLSERSAMIARDVERKAEKVKGGNLSEKPTMIARDVERYLEATISSDEGRYLETIISQILSANPAPFATTTSQDETAYQAAQPAITYRNTGGSFSEAPAPFVFSYPSQTENQTAQPEPIPAQVFSLPSVARESERISTARVEVSTQAQRETTTQAVAPGIDEARLARAVAREIDRRMFGEDHPLYRLIFEKT